MTSTLLNSNSAEVYLLSYRQSVREQVLPPAIRSAAPYGIGTPKHDIFEPIIAFSPFVFENNLNIEFRKVLDGRNPTDIIATGNSDVTAVFQKGCRDARWDEEPSTSSPPRYDIQISPVTTPSTDNSNQSASSTSSTTTWSDASHSPVSNSSVSLTYTPSSSISRSPLSITTSHQCRECPESFRLRGQLRTHWYRKHEKRFFCTEPGCAAAFYIKTDLTRHTESIHNDCGTMGRILCEHAGCGLTFSRRDNMMRHDRENHKNGGRKSRGLR